MKKRNFTITAHMVVKNEDRWIWFAIMSVIDFVDKLIIFDTGSFDNTNRIIETFLMDEKYSNKIMYERLGKVSVNEFYKVRQKQIEYTETDYFMVVDGDEIWYKDSLCELESILSEKKPMLVATRFINCCGDIWHYRYDNRESYCIKGIKGSITIRVYSLNIPGIKCGGDYGVEGFLDEKNVPVQEGGYDIEVMEGKYLHTSMLNRSSSQNGDFSIKYRRNKIHSWWDEKFDDDFKYPEVFYYKYPKVVKSPFEKDFILRRELYRIGRLVKRKLR